MQGSGFNWFDTDHLRIVTLPHTDVLVEAVQRLGTFLDRYDGSY